MNGIIMIGSNLSPIDISFTLKDHTYDLLKGAILDADIYNDATDLRLDERQLAEQLSISRTPIREALARLSQDGLVEILPRKGVYIVRKSLSDVLELVVVWCALESMAARLAVTHASDTDLKNLRKFAMESGSKVDIEEYSQSNILFHQRILELSNCSLLKKSADGLFQHMHAIRRRTMREDDRVSRSVVDHMGIIKALESRDADLSSRLVREHTMKLHDHIRQTWSQHE